MNTRLEIASRLKMANASLGVWIDNEEAVRDADALIAEEARTRPPAADAPTPDDLRAVAEELLSALDDAVDVGIEGHATTKKALAALCRARAMGLGGGR